MNRSEWFAELKRLAQVVYCPHKVSALEIEEWTFQGYKEYYEDGFLPADVLKHIYS